MPPARLSLREEDVVRLSLEFLQNRELHLSQLSLERETGLINGTYSDDVLFLRQLILDGQWEDVMEFIQPLEALQTFDMSQFKYAILRHKYIELLCIKSEANGVLNPNKMNTSAMDCAVEEVVQVLNDLQKFCPTKEEYSGLCLLLTLPRLSDHLQFKDWNPSKARIQCFQEIFPLIERFLPSDKKTNDTVSAKNDRLVQLVIKGLLYESCVTFCQTKATRTPESNSQEMTFPKLLDSSVGFSDSDLSLLSWLQSIPVETFSVPFEQRTLNVDVERIERPSLETSWTEHMLITPIKPKTFPHSVMPFTRPKSAADLMTRSLLPAIDHDLGMTTQSINRSDGGGGVGVGGAVMSRSSFASFHLTGLKPSVGKLMTSSVDRLFENDADVFLSTNFSECQGLPSIQEVHPLAVDDKNHSSHSLSNDDEEIAGDVTKTLKDTHLDGVAVDSRNEHVLTAVIPETLVIDDVRNGSDPGSRDLLGKFQKQKQIKVNELSTDELQLQQRSQPTQNVAAQSSNEHQNIATATIISSLAQSIENDVTTGTTFTDLDTKRSAIEKEPIQYDASKPKFVAVTILEDVQAVRCAEFHPKGKVYAVGSNSKTFRICEYPTLTEVGEEHVSYQPTVLFKRTKHHKGSIYCMAWSPQGDLIATGSNDKTIKLMRYNEMQKQLEGRETELTMHDGTVRDLCFVEDSTNKSSLLISGGAGDCKIYVTDCATSTPFQALSGHGGHILSLYNWGGVMFVSGSQDKTVRFWDLRTRGCVNMVTPATVPGSRQGSPVGAVCVDPSGRLLVSGHEDSSCVLYDIRGNRPIQCFKPHAKEIRSIRFSPSAYYLLTGGYDDKLILTDLQGDLTMPLPSVVVAQHSDKIISGRWHPTDFSFLSTSADKTAALWALPPI